VRYRVSDQEDALQLLLVVFIQIAERIPSPKEGLGPLVGEMIRQPIDLCAATQHYIAGDGVRLKARPWVNVRTGSDATGEQADKKIFH
jgi:hypothetical protein